MVFLLHIKNMSSGIITHFYIHVNGKIKNKIFLLKITKNIVVFYIFYLLLTTILYQKTLLMSTLFH